MRVYPSLLPVPTAPLMEALNFHVRDCTECVWIFSMTCTHTTAGNVSELEINPFEFAPDNHTLTITFTDELGNTGSAEFNFTSQERPGELVAYLSAAIVVMWGHFV